MMRYFMVALILAIIFFPRSLYAKTITVCFNDCDYSTIQGALDSLPLPGDTISITDAGTYLESLLLKNDGISGKAITLENDSGGTVLVQSTSNPILDIAGHDYWTIDGINFTYIGNASTPRVIYNSISQHTNYVTINNVVATRDGGSDGNVLAIYSSDHLTITNSTFNISAGSGGIDGATMIYTSNLEFKNNTIVGVNSALHDDGIVVTGVNLNIEDNTLHGGDTTSGHPDGIVIQCCGDQTNKDANTQNVTVRGNIVYDYGSAQIYVDAIWGDFVPYIRIYNNIVYETNSLKNYSSINGITITGENVTVPGNPYATPVEIYNNVIDTDQLGIRFWAATGGGVKVVENNILESCGYAAMNIANGIADITIDYNFYSDCDGRPIDWGGTVYTLAGFQSAKLGEANADEGNAGLDNNYRPASGSPVIDVGVDLSDIFSTDKDGVVRPQGSAWDIGAYEYKAPSVGLGGSGGGGSDATPRSGSGCGCVAAGGTRDAGSGLALFAFGALLLGFRRRHVIPMPYLSLATLCPPPRSAPKPRTCRASRASGSRSRWQAGDIVVVTRWSRSKRCSRRCAPGGCARRRRSTVFRRAV